MGQCRTLDADVTIGCYWGDYSSCENTIPFLFRTNNSPHTLEVNCSILFSYRSWFFFFSQSHRKGELGEFLQPS